MTASLAAILLPERDLGLPTGDDRSLLGVGELSFGCVRLTGVVGARVRDGGGEESCLGLGLADRPSACCCCWDCWVAARFRS
eukprot:10877414-Alexandrium_andersonii.AAC.1